MTPEEKIYKQLLQRAARRAKSQGFLGFANALEALEIQFDAKPEIGQIYAGQQNGNNSSGELFSFLNE